MSRQSVLPSPARLEAAVRALCPIIAEQSSGRAVSSRSEHELRRELVACILGSQVSYGAALLATENLESAGLLADMWWEGTECEEFEAHVFDILQGDRAAGRTSPRYRFPRARSQQIARARDAVATSPLQERLLCSCDPKVLRLGLISDISGIGPKQASMFLRNCGVTFELAVLDSHVLRFLSLQALVDDVTLSIGSISGYEVTEQVAISYAASIGYPVGFVDWAIWATMKAARELDS
jgi:N-glycosylase/DNA lyase